MEFKIESILQEDFPPGLLEIPEPPTTLSIVGATLPKNGLYLCVIGSRNHTSYGADVCQKLIAGLAGSPILIVSGLALGIDSIAHRAAIQAGLTTIAFPGSGLSENVLYPATNLSLAKEILSSGGTLVSEFEPRFRATKWSFPRRNRLMAGISHALLIIEAADKSGTLITASLALDYNKEIFSVPGPITSPQSLGTNLLIKQGATPVTRSEDILEFFGFTKEKEPVIDASPQEACVLSLLQEPLSREELTGSLIKNFDMSVPFINSLLSAMEIKGMIKEEFGEIRQI